MPIAGVIVRAGLWAALAFVLNLAWETAHIRLHTIWATADGIDIARAVLHWTLGDVLIALAMFGLAGLALWRADRPASHHWAGGIIVVIGAVGFTAWSEWYNVYRSGNWSYSTSMPMIFGIGLSPLLQWLVLPSVMIAAYRTLGPLLFVRHSSKARLQHAYPKALGDDRNF